MKEVERLRGEMGERGPSSKRKKRKEKQTRYEANTWNKIASHGTKEKKGNLTNDS